MANLVFYYGTMNCGKTAEALMLRFQYIERGFNVLLLKPSVDTRSDFTDVDGNVHYLVKSRIGLSAEAIIVSQQDNIYSLVSQLPDLAKTVIICDEAQFFTTDQIEQLKKISTEYNRPVYCYGLRTDFRTRLFEGSKRLFELADEVSELRSVCSCGATATVNVRLDKNGNAVKNGAQIEIGGNDRYRSMCWHCYLKHIR